MLPVGVERIHGGGDAAVDPAVGRFDGLFDALVDRILLVGAKSAEHIGRQWDFSRSVNTDSHACPLVSAELGGDIPQPVVPTSATGLSNPHSSARKRGVVHKDEQVTLGVKLVEPYGFTHRLAAAIDEGERLEQQHLFVSEPRFDDASLKSTPGDFPRSDPATQAVDRFEPDVVTGAIVFGTWVANADDKTHGSVSSGASALVAVLLFLLLRDDFRLAAVRIHVGGFGIGLFGCLELDMADMLFEVEARSHTFGEIELADC